MKITQWLLEAFEQLHISLAAFFAGGAGGFIMMTRQAKMTWWKAFTMVTSGALSAGYVAWPIIKTYDLSPSFVSAIGFCVGLFGMLLTDVIVSLLQIVAADPKIILDYLPFTKGRSNQSNQEDYENNNEPKSDTLDDGSSDAFGVSGKRANAAPKRRKG